MTPEGTTTGSTGEGTGCEPGSMGCECKDDSSCDDGLICASNECIPGDDPSTTTNVDETTGSSDPSTDPGTGSGTTSSTGSTTAQPPCDPANGVVDNPDCDTGLYCNATGDCVDCGGLESCAGVDANTPVCDDVSGTCVQCRENETSACGGETPVCDLDAMACAPCTDHGQCQSGACVLATGACFPANTVIWVDRLGANCVAATGAKDKPFCEIADAIDSIADQAPRLIRVKPSANYSEQVNISSNLTVAIMRESDSEGIITLKVANADSIRVGQNANVYLEDLAIYGEGPTTSVGVDCDDATLWMHRSEIIEKKGVGLVGSGCELAVVGTKLFSNNAGGLRVNGGSLRLENSFVGSNGSGAATLGGLSLENGATADIIYSTIAFNFAFGADAIGCAPGITGTARNSIVLGSGDQNSVTCGEIVFTTSAVDTGGLMGEMNKFFSPMELDTGWFIDAIGGDFHLAGGGDDFDGVAVWNAGDPAYDFDGDPRPSIDSSSDFAGADVP